MKYHTINGAPTNWFGCALFAAIRQAFMTGRLVVVHEYASDDETCIAAWLIDRCGRRIRHLDYLR